MIINFKNNHFYLLLVVLAALNFYLWFGIINQQQQVWPEIYFLNVGQGDSQLILLPNKNGGTVKILIDGGRDKKVLNELDRVLSKFGNDKYIDLVIVSHDDVDHSGGLPEVIRRYNIGAFIFNGRKSESVIFMETEKELANANKKMLALAAGDQISYLDNQLTILSPISGKFYKDDNEASLVAFLKTNGGSALFTGDIGFSTEKAIFTLSQGVNIKVDALKVAHHGSKYATGNEFLAMVKPRISVIGVGKNSYGHPTPAVLDRLATVGSNVYRTDRDDTIKIILDEK